VLKEIYTAAMGMVPQQTRLEVTANNLANASTPGFKRANVFERNLIEAKGHFFNVNQQVEQDDPPIGSYTDFSLGAMQQTDNVLDLAIGNENGFFVLQDEAGNRFLSRTGHFKLSTDGTIQAMDGKMLLGNEGSLNIKRDFLVDDAYYENSNNTKLEINSKGEVFANQNLIGSVQLVKVDDNNQLIRSSSSYFVPKSEQNVTVIPQEEADIRQGWIENSNVNIINEMVSMIELQRSFELGSKVIQTNNDTLDKSIGLGRFY
jgi:flagellar basal-body rod protein FlgF